MNHCQKTEQPVKVQRSEAVIEWGDDLLWLMPLLTNEASGTDSFFANTCLLENSGLSRAGLIKESLSSVAPLLRKSRIRTEKRFLEGCFNTDALPPPSWSAELEVSREQLQNALLRMDLFPRCLLLLTLFEGMPLTDLPDLLAAPKELIQSTHQLALVDLTRNIAFEQGWSTTLPSSKNSIAVPALTCQ